MVVGNGMPESNKKTICFFGLKNIFKNNRLSCEMSKIHNRTTVQKSVSLGGFSRRINFLNRFYFSVVFGGVMEIGCKRFHNRFFRLSCFRFWHSVGDPC